VSAELKQAIDVMDAAEQVWLNDEEAHQGPWLKQSLAKSWLAFVEARSRAADLCAQLGVDEPWIEVAS
jgi:hypothetical protein